MLKYAIPKYTSVADTLGNIFQAAAGRAWTRHIQTWTRHTCRTSNRQTSHFAPAAVSGTASAHEDSGQSSQPAVPSPLRLRIVPKLRIASAVEPHPYSSLPVEGIGPNAFRNGELSPSKLGDTGSSPSLTDSADLVAADPQGCLSVRERRLSRVRTPPDIHYIVERDSPPMYDKFRDPEQEKYINIDESMHPPTVCAGPLATLPPPSLPQSRTSSDLCQHLLFLLHYTKPPSVPRLINYHDAYPNLHSTTSFNLLFQHCIRHASYGTVHNLLLQMSREGFEPNTEMWKLWVRWMVKTGRWQHAWSEVTSKTTSIPLPVWLEFFGSVHSRAFRKRDNETGKPIPAMQELQPSPELEATRYALLVQHWPKVDVTLYEHLQVQPHAIRVIVSSLLRSNLSSSAIQITKSYLENLPSQLTRKERSGCLDIIHQHLIHHPMRTVNWPAYAALRELIGAFITSRPELGLRPTSTTLLLLLRGLKRAGRCGTIANAIMLEYKSRWGHSVVDERVRRRVASFARKEGRSDIVNEMMSEQEPVDVQRQIWQVQTTVIGGSRGDRSQHRRLLRWQWRKTLVRRHKEMHNWTALRRRIRQNVNIQA
ncbi:hypothetical protein NEOLEDRAFT_1237853 [Neolentinus lepideus HHB14362 ss-1]|uniref:Uncharacterized protein n=1 Tax=Neolentinus lepideus HHB14362 ss-1 TaxID=1314782 RepID=A0A165W3M9_9AGAM|nr:hypothetical protein NEOLEDRAFT_1237853 [Neolentinus lepideus HHB14362 ss-1]